MDIQAGGPLAHFAVELGAEATATAFRLREQNRRLHLPEER